MAFERSWPLVIFVSVQEKDINVSMQTEDVEGPINAGDVVGPSMQNEENQPREEQAMGMADEGERVGIIVDEMEREDSDNEEADDDASSDEEGDVMATDWANEDFSGLVISEGDHVPWEYKENEVIDGARYAHKDEMKEAVKHWAVSLQREFRVVKSTNYVYEVRCMKEDCPWHVHAYKGKWNDYWKVSIVTEHKCYLQGVEKYHRNITSAFVASEMYSSVVGNIGFEPKSIIRHIENKFKYTISYAKAWRAKQKIIEMRYGTFEASYDNLPRLLATIAQRNNNTYYDLHTFTSVDDRTKSVLQRAFFSLGACINAFVHCRPVLCIDGTFMTGKYRGQILTAIGCDGNNQVLPMAFAFVESENTESWYWFLERVHIVVVRMRPNVCLIHDRHAGMLRAIDYLQNGWDEKGLPAKWPDVRSRWCMRHMGANFYKQFKNKHLMELFKRLCAQNQEKKFNELWDKLDELTTKQTDEQSRRPQVEGDEPPILLGALHDDPPTMRRRSGSSIRNFTQWIENEPGFAVGIFGTGASSSHAGRTGPTSQFYDDDLHGAHHHDVLGSSQLEGAPEAHTQEQPEVTPVQAGRVGRAVPPDRLTYSQGHIRAQGRRDRVLFIHMVLEQLMLTTTHFRRFTTYRPMCNFIEWVDMENPQNDGTRAYPRSETRSDYLRRKDEHERRIAAEALECLLTSAEGVHFTNTTLLTRITQPVGISHVGRPPSFHDKAFRKPIQVYHMPTRGVPDQQQVRSQTILCQEAQGSSPTPPRRIHMSLGIKAPLIG
uniref:Mutator-like transposase n=2 Tax=Oryza sativa subsp. japonica TaxID=39947 RepID=Q10EM5_ORYSJ|nr:putative mutator-like transposase [Oryza sativa Japonica Group]ABF99047.1 retrotransposon protein, putative, Ty3-gypsy subclass [Oryza sativa Japonica Group]